MAVDHQSTTLSQDNDTANNDKLKKSDRWRGLEYGDREPPGSSLGPFGNQHQQSPDLLRGDRMEGFDLLLHFLLRL